MKIQFTTFLTFLFAGLLIGQVNEIPSIHQEQLEQYNLLGNATAEYYEANTTAAPMNHESVKNNCTLNKVVYGWHPYWAGNAYQNYQWDLLSHMSFFSYEVNPSTGYAITTHGFETSAAVTTALAQGTKVTLTATLFSNHNTFFSSSTTQQNFISNIISIVQNRGAHGVNIDFEGLTSSHKTVFANFMVNLANQMHAAIPGSHVSTVLYAVEWDDRFDINAMKNAVDHFIIMGYDYYYSGSATTGPSDPLYHFGTTYNYTLSKSITHYLNKGCPKNKLVVGLPYYGRDWPTNSATVPTSTTGSGAAVQFNAAMNNSGGYYTAANHQFNTDTYTDIFVKSSGGFRQCFISLEDAFRKRLEHINNTGVGGMAIWALGYDDGYSQLWNAIEDYMTDCFSDPCSGTIHDFGGPNRNYYDNENYTWTIAPNGASSITLQFSSFDVENGYDFLYIYDGNSTSDPQIPGSPFTGTSLPPSFTSSTGALTFRFTSDGATTKPGFLATYTCNTDNTPPTTGISFTNDWKTEDFEVNFNDADESGGSGLWKSLYSVHSYNGTQWTANSSRGFYMDEFEGSSINPAWTSHTGTWNLSNGVLKQSNEGLGSTNISTSIQQNLSNMHLYHWKGKITGSDENKRAGIHFFSTNPSQENGGDSYLVYFRMNGNSDPNNNNKVQIYKSVGNTLEIKKNEDFTINANQWYDFKVAYDRITGYLYVWVNDQLAAHWQDPSPINNPTGGISFRSGNAVYEIDDFNVYRSRFPDVTVSVGPGNSTDVFHQNPNPSTKAGKVKSIVLDNAGNVSTISTQTFDVDWTAPTLSAVNDGSGADIDSTYSATIEANWSGNDPHSGIVDYEVAIGTTQGGTDIMGWTSVGTNTSHSFTLPNPIENQIYYYTVTAENGAGLTTTVSSDGQKYVVEDDEEEPGDETCETPEDVFVDNITNESADVSWTAGGGETSWEVVYGPTGFNPNTGGTSVVVTSTNYSITGLDAEITYDVYVRAICDNSESDWTSVETFTMLEDDDEEPEPGDDTCEAPTDIIIDNITESSATISWQAGEGQVMWAVIYGPEGFDPQTEGDTEYVGLNPTITIGNLDAETTYDVYIVTICDASNMIISDPLVGSFTTDEEEEDDTSSLLVNNTDGINVYPNPFDSKFYLSNPNNETLQLYFMDEIGKIIFVRDIKTSVMIDLESYNLSTGNYFLRIQSQESVTVFKLIKK